MVGGQDGHGLESHAFRSKISTVAKPRSAMTAVPMAARSKAQSDEKKSFPLETAFHEF
jgi:hypothetical protein